MLQCLFIHSMSVTYDGHAIKLEVETTDGKDARLISQNDDDITYYNPENDYISIDFIQPSGQGRRGIGAAHLAHVR